MTSIFHHLKVPNEKPTALVKAADLDRWLKEVAETEISVPGKKQGTTRSGFSAHPADDLTADTHPWQISKGREGWIIAPGTVEADDSSAVSARIPNLNGDSLEAGSESEPPQLAYRSLAGVIAVEVSIRITHPITSGISSAAFAALLPVGVFTQAWLAWPEIKWLEEIAATPTLTIPNVNNQADITLAIPLARISGSRVIPLRTTNVKTIAMIHSIVAI